MVRDTSSIFTKMTWGRKFLWSNRLGLKWQKKWSMTLDLSGRRWNKPKIIKRVMQITIGGKVFPKVTLYRHVIRLKRRGKLASTFIYPFEILERISKEILVFYINMNLWNCDFIIEKKLWKLAWYAVVHEGCILVHYFATWTVRNQTTSLRTNQMHNCPPRECMTWHPLLIKFYLKMFFHDFEAHFIIHPYPIKFVFLPIKKEYHDCSI